VKLAYRQVFERLRQVPGVTASGGVSSIPMSEMYSWGPIQVEGRAPQPGEKFINADQRVVGGDYFEAMQIPLRQGRGVNSLDTDDTQRVVIVDEHTAAEFWPKGDAVGKRIRLGEADSTSPWLMIVGVVGRVKQYSLDEDSRIAVYFPIAQFAAREMNLVARSQ